MAHTTKRVRKAPAPRAGVFVSEFSIRSFKSLAAATLELGRVNVFIGANGAGKTGILEAFGLAGAAADGRVTDDDLIDRGVRPGVPKLFKSAFEDARIPRAIVVAATSTEEASYRVQLDNPQELANTPWRFMSETFSESGRKILTRSPRGGNAWSQGHKDRLASLDPYRGLARSRIPTLPAHVERLRGLLQRFRIYDPQTAVLRGIQGDVRQLDPIGLQGGRLAEAFASLRREPGGDDLLENVTRLVPWASDVATEAPTPDLLSPSVPAVREIVRFTDRFMKRDRNQLSAYDASEGALYVLFSLALLSHPRAPVFLAIENIDHALHPRLARALMSRICDVALANGRQLLITTHNPLVLDGLALRNQDIRLFTVDRASNGYSIVKRVPYTKAIAEAEKKKLTLSQIWVRGLIGGTPDIW